MRRVRLFLAAGVALLLTLPAISQDVRNTYIAVAAQVADGIITNAKLANASVTFAGKTAALGASTTIACADLSNGATGCSTTVGTIATQNYTATTWTPTVITDGTVGAPAYSVQVGSYEQIGRQVTARLDVQLSGWTGSPTGSVSISGLPAASANVTNDFGVCSAGVYSVAGLNALNYGITGSIVPNTSAITLKQASNTGTGNISAAQFGATAVLTMVCSYRAS